MLGHGRETRRPHETRRGLGIGGSKGCWRALLSGHRTGEESQYPREARLVVLFFVRTHTTVIQGPLPCGR
eukprot:scaffold44988_cov67-Phaeocystis_antarctica.AAC.6